MGLLLMTFPLLLNVGLHLTLILQQFDWEGHEALGPYVKVKRNPEGENMIPSTMLTCITTLRYLLLCVES